MAFAFFISRYQRLDRVLYKNANPRDARFSAFTSPMLRKKFPLKTIFLIHKFLIGQLMGLYLLSALITYLCLFLCLFISRMFWVIREFMRMH